MYNQSHKLCRDWKTRKKLGMSKKRKCFSVEIQAKLFSPFIQFFIHWQLSLQGISQQSAGVDAKTELWWTKTVTRLDTGGWKQAEFFEPSDCTSGGCWGMCCATGHHGLPSLGAHITQLQAIIAEINSFLPVGNEFSS